jgi:helix-turn-helix protein
MNPEEILTRDALTKPHRTVIDRSQVEQSQIRQLTMALKQQMIKEIRESENEKSINSCLGVGSPGEIRTPVGGSKARHDCPLHHRAKRVLQATFSGIIFL